MKRYSRLAQLVAFNRPQVIIEIGTHKAARASLMCTEALRHQEAVHYIGYDLFEDATAETDKREMNGKGAGSEAAATAVLDEIRRNHQGFTYELVKGDTRTTLHGTEQRADFVFIDGGHSLETICGDYEAVQGSRLIVFDDYYTRAGDLTENFGCNAIMQIVPHEIMPEEDRIRNGIGVRLAVVGYSSRWEKAITRLVQQDRHKTVSLWRGGHVQYADLVCACNTLERELDLEKALEQIREFARKRFFFVIKADALRSLSWWKDKLTQHFQVLEWFEQGDEVVGTAISLMATNQYNVVGAMSHDERFEAVKYNCALTPKRVKHWVNEQGELLSHNRKAIIVAYGPSLRHTWDNIIAEKKFGDEVDIITMSGSHDFLLRRDIKPDFHIECDPRAHKALNLTDPRQGINYYIASCCHPDLTNKLKDYDLSLWHSMNGNEDYRIGDEIESERYERLVMGGGSVGLRAISLFYSVGYRNFVIYGMDCSFGDTKDGSPVTKQDEDMIRWAGAHKGKKKDVIKARCGDRWFLTSPVDMAYARHFIQTAQACDGATSFSFVGDGLLQTMVRQMAIESQEKAA